MYTEGTSLLFLYTRYKENAARKPNERPWPRNHHKTYVLLCQVLISDLKRSKSFGKTMIGDKYLRNTLYFVKAGCLYIGEGLSESHF